MSFESVLPWAASLLLALAPSLPVAEESAVASTLSPSATASLQGDCKTCGGTGLVPCRACRRDACPEQPWPALRRRHGEQGPPPPPHAAVLFCSVPLACGTCGGLGVVACPRCDAGAEALRALAQRRAAIDAWKARMAAIDAFLGRPLLHAESAHFVLTFDLGRVDAPGADTPHRAMHLYLDRLEALFTRFAADLSARPEKDFSSKVQVLLWSSRADQERASPRFTQQPSSTESKLMGASPVVSIFYDPSHLHEESEMHQALVHQVTHCLLSNVFDGIWPGNIGGGWLDSGLAHAYEIALFGGVRHYCYVESDTLRDFEFGRWEPDVRTAVDSGEALPFLQVVGRNTADLTPREHLFAWSFVDFLLRAHPGKLGAVARGVKEREPLVRVLQENLGTTPFAFDESWKAFVRERYATRAR